MRPLVGRATDPFLQAAGEVDDGYVGGGHTERHSGEFAVEARDHFADGLGGAGRRRDDVGGGRSTAAPVLVARPVDRLLRGRVRVDGRHQALDDVVLLMDHFGQRRQTVGRARRVADPDTQVSGLALVLGFGYSGSWLQMTAIDESVSKQVRASKVKWDGKLDVHVMFTDGQHIFFKAVYSS